MDPFGENCEDLSFPPVHALFFLCRELPSAYRTAAPYSKPIQIFAMSTFHFRIFELVLSGEYCSFSLAGEHGLCRAGANITGINIQISIATVPIHKLLGKIYVIIVLCLHLARGDVKLGMFSVWFYLCAWRP